MKQTIKKIVGMFMLLIVPLYFFSCSDDEPSGPKVLLPKLDGFYVFGTNTVAESPSEPSARMARALLDTSKPPAIENREGVYGKFIYIGANSEIQFAEVVDGVGTVYGDQAGGTSAPGNEVGNTDNKDVIVHGKLKKDAAKIRITDAGLYYVTVNVNTRFFSISKVTANIIGDTTPGNWANGTLLPVKSSGLDSTVFEVTDLILKGESGYRYRLCNGWAFYDSSGYATTLSSLGVLSYGDSWPLPANDIGFYLDNAPHQTNGVYTVRLKYSASTGEFKETKIKTGEVLIDYSGSAVAIIGDATEGGCFCGDGTGGYGQKTPSKSGNVYTWTWNDVPMIQDKEFIFLQNATWGAGLQIDYAGASVSGSAISTGNIIDATASPVNGEYHNFYVITGGTYDVTLVIDAAANTRTVTINNN